MLTIQQAEDYISNNYNNSNMSDEEEFFYVECMEYLVDVRGNVDDCLLLGGYYYANRQFDLALECYEMALNQRMDNFDEVGRVCDCLGYIYYYGRVGKPNYELAFHYYSMASNAGNLEATMKVADMYHNGYYVDKDDNKYEEIILSLYAKVKDTTYLFDPLPEVFSRLAKIYVKKVKIDKAIQLLHKAKSFQSQRLQYSSFFGDLTIMKWIILDLYTIDTFHPNEIDLFDLYYVLLKPNVVTFMYQGDEYIIESKEREGNLYITYHGNNYEDIDTFFKEALLDNEKLSTKYFDIDYMEINTWK